jgi:hypothetical protein
LNLLVRTCSAAPSAAPTSSASSSTAPLARILFKLLSFLKHFRNIFPAARRCAAQGFFHVACPLHMEGVRIFLGAFDKVLSELRLAPTFQLAPQRVLKNRF